MTAHDLHVMKLSLATIEPQVSSLYTSRIYLEVALKTAKIFKHGNSQAVRLPKEFRFESHEVLMRRASGGILLRAPKIEYSRVLEAVSRFEGTLMHPHSLYWRLSNIALKLLHDPFLHPSPFHKQ